VKGLLVASNLAILAGLLLTSLLQVEFTWATCGIETNLDTLQRDWVIVPLCH
jgi:hypothetical protein